MALKIIELCRLGRTANFVIGLQLDNEWINEQHE